MPYRDRGSARTLGAAAAAWLFCFASAPEASAQVPPAPTLESPESGSTIYTATPTYTWNEASGATDYTLNVRDANNTILTTSYTAAAVCSGSTCSVTPGSTLSQATYYWKVRGTNGSGNGPWSTELSFAAVPPNWNQGFACTGVFLTGDFNGDGRTDRLCSQSGTTNVSLATPTGFASSAAWLGSVFLRPVVADFNGDGKDDVAEFKPSTGIFQVATSTGTAFTTLTNWGTATATFNGTPHNCKIDPIGTGSGDFDGDGLPDVWCKRNTDGYIFVGRSTGTSFTFSIFADYTCASGSQVVGAVDIDGDGKSDWYSIAQNDTLCARLSNGTEFTTLPLITLPSTYCAQDKYLFADLNGDGRTDVHCPTNGKVALSTGLGFLDQGTFGAWCNVGTTQVMAGNLDGDGPTELICNNPNSPLNDIEVRKWTGTALDSAQVWLESWCAGQAGGGDFDGDGKTDLLCDQVTIATGGKAGLMPDIMTLATNGIGGAAAVTYVPSTVFPSTNNPHVKHVVTSLTRNDGRGGSSTWTYSYAGGKVDRQERQFLGFAYIRTNEPCIADEGVCPYSDASFSQELASPGRPTLSTHYDGGGQALRTVSTIYANNNNVPRTSLLTQVDAYSYDGSGASKQTTSTYQYDAYGNRTQAVFSGDAATGGDELQTDSVFVPNTSAYIVDRVARVERRGPGGSLLTSGEFLYDGAGSWSQPPAKGDLTKVRSLLDTDGSYVSSTIGYDALGNPTSVTDATNRTVTTSYDGADQIFPVSTTNAAGETSTAAWDAACQVPTQVTDANGQATTIEYDALCRTTQTSLPLGAFAIQSYQDLGDPGLQHTRVETPGAAGTGNDWSEDYFDGLGRVYRSKRRGPGGQAIIAELSYNARGGLDSATAPFYQNDASYMTTYEYDSLDRPTAVRHPDGTEVLASYGLWSLTGTDENGKSATTRFDAYGRPVVQERSLNGQVLQTHSTYDPLGRLVGITDAVGNTWSWNIDSLGRAVSGTDPDSGSWTATYDAAGRPTSGTDAKGQVTAFSYDTVGRLSSKTNTLGTVSFGWGEARAGYYNAASLTSVNAPGVTQQLDYDALGRVVRQNRIVDGVSYVAAKEYDEASGVVGLTYPDGEVIGTIQYDEAGRVRSIPGFVNDVTYDALGRPLQQSNANGTQTAWTYSAERGFLERIHTTGPATTQDLSYTNDAAGLVTHVTSPNANEDWSYGYDDLYRLTDATSSSNPAESQSFVYDEVGRITYNSRVGTYGYPGAGQPRPHAPSSVNGNPYSYDANGNLVSGGGRTPVWDAENRITQIGSAQFSYDGFGERVKKTAPGVTSLYPFGDDYEITNGQVTKYLSVGGLGVVAKRVGGATYWLHTDRQGSIQALTDAAGTEVLRRTYRPYGDKIADSTGHVESRGWIDQRQDAETDLTYLHARYYDSELGIFMSPDPIGPAGGLNAFAYASGNPVNASDRSGLLEALEGNGRQIAITYGNDDGGSLTDDLVWRSVTVGGFGSGALFGLLRLITGGSGDGPRPDSGSRSGPPGTGGYNTEGDGHERPTGGGGRRDPDWTPGGGGPGPGGPPPPDVPPGPGIPPGGTGGMPGDRQPGGPGSHVPRQHPPLLPRSGGISGDAAATLGVFPVHVGGIATAGLGYFSASGVGSFTSRGWSYGPFGLWPWKGDRKINGQHGAYVGGGLGLWISNARTPSDLSRTNYTIALNFGSGTGMDLQGGYSLSWGQGIWHFGYNPVIPGSPTGWGVGSAILVQRTNTAGMDWW